MAAIIGNINALLEPVLFQVIGTTPESLVESVKRSNLEGRIEAGSQLAAIAVFAAAVNKTVLGEFMMKSELSAVRGTVLSQFSIRNQANMTALTLLGHCFYLTKFANQIKFAQEFRKKMGQQSIWDGDLTGGSLSETQRKILQEKSKSINVRSATLFATGYFKFIGADSLRWTTEESRFWDVQHRVETPSPPRATASGSGPRVAPIPSTISLTVPELGNISVSRKAYDYYMEINDNDVTRLNNSIRKNGVREWNKRYEELADEDLQREGHSGTGTVVG